MQPKVDPCRSNPPKHPVWLAGVDGPPEGPGGQDAQEEDVGEESEAGQHQDGVEAHQVKNCDGSHKREDEEECLVEPGETEGKLHHKSHLDPAFKIFIH